MTGINKRVNRQPGHSIRICLAIIFVIVIPLILNCTPNSCSIVILYESPPAELDPHLRREVERLTILSNIYETLVAFDANLKMMPCLAEYWERIDSLNWRFYLRQNVRFHNQHELTARDVHYSLYRPLALAQSEYGYYREYIDTIIIEATDRLIIRLKKPYAFLLYDLVPVFIVPENFQPPSSKPCGTGPYYYVRGNNKEIVIKYFSNYRDKNISVKEAHFLFVAEPEKRIEMLSNKQADIITFIPLDMLPQLSQAGKIVATEGTGTRYLEMNLKGFPFNKKEFRQAINLAIDRDKLISKVYHGYASPANQYITPGLYGFDYTLPPCVYDPESAMKILRKIGELPTIEFDFAGVRATIGNSITEDLQRVGLKIKANPLPIEKYWQKIENHLSNFYIIGSVPTSNEGITTLKGLFHTYLPQKGMGIQNRIGYSNQEVDNMIEKMLTVSDLKQTMQMLIETQRMILEDLPKIPLVWEKEIYGVSERLQWHPRLDDKIVLKEINFVK